MHTLILALLLAGSGTGMQYQSGATRSAPVILASHRDTAASGRTLSSTHAAFNGTVVQLEWTQVTTGVDGLGAGNNVFRVSVLIDEADACHLDVACDAAAGADYVATCDGLSFVAGQDVDVRFTSMPCLGAPTGFQTTTLRPR